MKKIVNFEKEINFPSMIGEINTISLDHNVKFINENQATGNLIVSGTYKMTEASTILEDFKYELPVEIDLAESIDLDSGKISINDFNYEIINEDILKCNIDLLVEGVESLKVEEDIEVLEELVRECDGEEKEDEEKELPKIEIENTIEEIKEEKEEDNSNIGSLFQAFENSTETFKTYSVYIMRKDDTIEKVLDKYKINIDQLEEYNDISNIEIGTKLIIPSVNE